MIRQQPPEKHVSQQHNRLAGQHRQPAEEWARGKGNSSGTGSAASDLSVTWDVRVRRWLHGGVRKMEGKLIGLCPFISDTLHNSRWQASEERRRGWLQRQRRTFLKNQKCLFFFPPRTLHRTHNLGLYSGQIVGCYHSSEPTHHQVLVIL